MTEEPGRPAGTEPSPAEAPVPEDPAAVPGWRRALGWVESLIWIGLLAFAVVRLGPQVGAWLGVGPTLGAAPEFSVRTLDGQTLDNEGLRGQVTIVNFWATWCPPCRIEIPALQSLHEDFADEGLVVLGLSTDAGGAGSVQPFLEERGVTYPVAMADGATRTAFGGVTALPTTFILDRDGVIQHRVFGFFAPPAMRAAVRRLLRESNASTAGEADPTAEARADGTRANGTRARRTGVAGTGAVPAVEVPAQSAGSLLLTSTNR